MCAFQRSSQHVVIRRVARLSRIGARLMFGLPGRVPTGSPGPRRDATNPRPAGGSVRLIFIGGPRFGRPAAPIGAGRGYCIFIVLEALANKSYVTMLKLGKHEPMASGNLPPKGQRSGGAQTIHVFDFFVGCLVAGLIPEASMASMFKVVGVSRQRSLFRVVVHLGADQFASTELGGRATSRMGADLGHPAWLIMSGSLVLSASCLAFAGKGEAQKSYGPARCITLGCTAKWTGLWKSA